MSNPWDCTGDPYVDLMMSMFWLRGKDEEEDHHLQTWQDKERVLELNTNIRSGDDEWYSEVLDQCRQGQLSEANYNFLHGLPTREKITFWYEYKDERVKPHDLNPCSLDNLCEACIREKQRRNRILNFETDADGAAHKLAEPKFKNCVLITPFNKAVFQFAIHRAQSFAAANGQQLFWMQAIDSPPAWFAGSMNQTELEEMKRNWLQYHAKKTEGVLSICPGCYDMPMRITHGNGYMFKQYNIHNGATCFLRGMELADVDVEYLKTTEARQVVLQALPKRLIVHMSRPMKKQYPGMPKDCFPLSPVTVYWTLDVDGDIQISRRGFPIVPNFSMTVDSATGKTLDTAIADLGDFAAVPSFTRAMKGYIALSRVRKAQDLYLPQPFSPCLFQQGEQPWPSLLLRFLRGHAEEFELEELCEETKKKQRTKVAKGIALDMQRVLQI